ncbi:diacylglycerol O-acyltransferase 2-like [Protopterus annectens]|uniref:diacylglycerol O-acyltransferase 2-like n=1 Tax=Protopterus annectens TaxID=7888 RepID=UPI001CFB4FCA|nr:diacylglycerol O-acyltransferase 2-like [Protopterus annectens]
MKTIIAAYSGVLKGYWQGATKGVQEMTLQMQKEEACFLSSLKVRQTSTGASILSALQELPSIPWFSKSKFEKQLQALAVLQWILSFLFMGIISTTVVLFLFFTDFWPISAAYFAWYVFDWNTPQEGGRRSEWVRNCVVWRYFRDHFPGICPVNRDTLDYILSKSGTGNAVVIVVGGAAESLNCTSGKNCVILKERKGFVKLALQHGADLVPVYSFGENDVYKQVIFEEGSSWRSLQKKMQKVFGVAPCLFFGNGVLSEDTWGLLPFARPINTVIGEPITIPKLENPSPDDVDFYHQLYMRSLSTLFDQYKLKFGLAETDVLELN